MARFLRSLAPTLLAGTLALLWAGSAPAAGKLVEQTVDVPREHRVPLAIAFDKSTLFGLESNNEPKPDDVEEAKAKDPNDKTWVLLRFYYRNEGWTRQKVSLSALLLDESGGVLAEAKGSKTLGKQKAEDTVTLWFHPKTLDWGRAAKMKVVATFLEP